MTTMNQQKIIDSNKILSKNVKISGLEIKPKNEISHKKSRKIETTKINHSQLDQVDKLTSKFEIVYIRGSPKHTTNDINEPFDNSLHQNNNEPLEKSKRASKRNHEIPDVLYERCERLHEGKTHLLKYNNIEYISFFSVGKWNIELNDINSSVRNNTKIKFDKYMSNNVNRQRFHDFIHSIDNGIIGKTEFRDSNTNQFYIPYNLWFDESDHSKGNFEFRIIKNDTQIDDKELASMGEDYVKVHKYMLEGKGKTLSYTLIMTDIYEQFDRIINGIKKPLTDMEKLKKKEDNRCRQKKYREMQKAKKLTLYANQEKKRNIPSNAPKKEPQPYKYERKTDTIMSSISIVKYPEISLRLELIREKQRIKNIKILNEYRNWKNKKV